MAGTKGKIEFTREKTRRGRRHGWMITSTNGQVVAMSAPRGFKRMADAKRSVRRTRAILNAAQV